MSDYWIDVLANSLAEAIPFGKAEAGLYTRTEAKRIYSGVACYVDFSQLREAVKPLTPDQWQELSDVTRRMGYPISTAREVFTGFNYNINHAEAGALAELGARVGLAVEIKRRLDFKADKLLSA